MDIDSNDGRISITRFDTSIIQQQKERIYTMLVRAGCSLSDLKYGCKFRSQIRWYDHLWEPVVHVVDRNMIIRLHYYSLKRYESLLNGY